MKQIVLGRSVQGASHKRAQVECQDSFEILELEDGAVAIAVADGHGSRECPYSKSGSSIAVNVFCRQMAELYAVYRADLQKLLTYLNREGETKIAQIIDAEWKRRVLNVHKKQKRKFLLNASGEKDKEAIYKQYGTTLVGVLLTPGFVFALQIGDGDIMCVDKEKTGALLAADKILGTETHSLSKMDAWKQAVSVVARRETAIKPPALLMLSTDGFSNSYKNEQEFEKTCMEYFRTVEQYGPDAIKQNLKNWLTETSEQGCGDDITLIMIYFEANE